MSDSDSSEASDDNDTISNSYVTLGKSSDFETVIWRFPNIVECPLKNCKLSCSSRMTCLAHFRMHHAEICMICTFCDELFLVVNPLHLLRHHQVHHPNEQPPKLKETEDIPSNSETTGNAHNKIVIEKDIDYKITLYGCGIETNWIFPDITVCPNRLCKREFKNRSQTMKHFCDEHAAVSILCGLCQKPISVKGSSQELHLLIRHYQRMHPNTKLPYGLSKSSLTQVQRNTRSGVQPKIKIESNDNDDDDDFITLYSCGITTKWRFPENLNECIIQTCHQKFKSKSDGMAHFTENHAIGSILCELCDRPVRSSHGSKDFRRHYEHKHPNLPVPFNFGQFNNSHKITNSDNVQAKKECSDENDLIQLKYGKWRFPNTSQCPVLGCRIQFDGRLDAMIHYKQQHAMDMAVCNFCNRPIRININSYALVSHFRRMHPNKKVPYGLDKSANQPIDQKFHAEVVENSNNNAESDEDELADDMIVLSGCGLKFLWKFPQSAQCPVKNCKIQFNKRSEAIVHYKKTHAEKSTLCPDCNTPKSARKFSDMVYHYKSVHPNDELPTFFKKSSEKKNMNEKPVIVKTQRISFGNVSHLENGSQPMDYARDDGDVILLSACGIITQFQFPKSTKQCPVGNCRLKFEERSDCIAHYRSLHAKGSIMCPSCVRPLRINQNSKDFIVHFNRLHPNDAMPYDFITKKVITNGHATSTINRSPSRSDTNANDLIKLTSSSRVTYWKFPKDNWQICPAFRCHLKFETRSDAMEHFKMEHSKNAICCRICDKPVAVHKIGDFRDHYNRRHPHNKFPIGIGLTTVDSQLSQMPVHQIKEEIQDDNEDEGEDDLIELTTCGITTQWLFPDNCRQCPVGNCRQHFRTKSDGIKHYKKLHAFGSICCPVCDEPIRSMLSLNDFHNHFRKRHPHVKVPYKTGTKGFFPRKQKKHQLCKSDEDDDENDDIIILSAFGQSMKWKFPKYLTKCPSKKCLVSTADREALKAHYRDIHAKSAYLCSVCNRPVPTQNQMYHLNAHYRTKHPNVAVPTFDSTNNERTSETRQTKVEIDSKVACNSCDVRVEPEDMNEHMKEMHSSHRIYCPLKLCSYVAQQMAEMHTHWNREHIGMKFPEFRDETNFTYVINASNDIDVNQKNLYTRMDLTKPIKKELLNGEGSSTSTEQHNHVVIDSSDSESSGVKENLPLQVLTSNKRKKSSDSRVWFTGIETYNDNYVDGVPNAKRHKQDSKPNGKRRRSSSSSSSSSTCSSDNDMNKSRKVAIKRVYQSSDDNMKATNSISLDATKECSVRLERLNSLQTLKLNKATSSSTITTTSTESMSSNKIFYVADSDEEGPNITCFL